MAVSLAFRPIYGVIHWNTDVTWLWWLLSLGGGIISLRLLGGYLAQEHAGLTIIALLCYIVCGWGLIFSSDFENARYVALYLGENKRSQIYVANSDGAKWNVMEDRGDDAYRTVRHFIYWETAWLEGFKPNRIDIPQAGSSPIILRLIKFGCEKAIYVFPFWIGSVLICSLILKFKPTWIEVK